MLSDLRNQTESVNRQAEGGGNAMRACTCTRRTALNVCVGRCRGVGIMKRVADIIVYTKNPSSEPV
jgi:hypothetical protein